MRWPPLPKIKNRKVRWPLLPKIKNTNMRWPPLPKIFKYEALAAVAKD